jgi:ribonuclease P protein component
MVLSQNNKFNKSERLNKNSEINLIFEQGKSFYEKPFVIYYLISGTDTNTPLKIIISAPKKKIPKANKRNFLKRRIREAFRKNKHSLTKLCLKKNISLNIAIIYSQNTIEDYNIIEQKLVLSLQKLEQLI